VRLADVSFHQQAAQLEKGGITRARRALRRSCGARAALRASAAKKIKALTLRYLAPLRGGRARRRWALLRRSIARRLAGIRRHADLSAARAATP